MWSMNLLILMSIIFAYIFLGGGVYMLLCILENQLWDDFEAIYCIFLWPFVLLMLMPYIIVRGLKWIWTMILADVLTRFKGDKE